MDSVVLDGVEYVKASVIAKRFKYTSDYVGQLCRGKKVDARLVGRTWFVNPESITEHKKNKHTKLSETDQKKELKVVSNTNKTKTSRVKVSPVIKSKTFKAIVASNNIPVSTERKLRVQYERDEESLIPTITRIKTKAPVMVRIEPANAKKLKVKGKKKPSDFEAEERPDFALSGKVGVESLREAEELDTPEEPKKVDNKPENIAKTAKPDVVKITPKSADKVETKKKTLDKDSTKVKLKVLRPEHMKGIVKPKPTKEFSKKLQVADVKVSVVEPEPETVLVKTQIEQTKSFTPKLVEDDAKVQKETPAYHYSSLIFTLLGALITLFIFSASSVTLATSDSYDSKLLFNLENIESLFE